MLRNVIPSWRIISLWIWKQSFSEYVRLNTWCNATRPTLEQISQTIWFVVSKSWHFFKTIMCIKIFWISVSPMNRRKLGEVVSGLSNNSQGTMRLRLNLFSKQRLLGLDAVFHLLVLILGLEVDSYRLWIPPNSIQFTPSHSLYIQPGWYQCSIP